MSNAKALTKLSGPVGAEPRPETSKGAKVRNAAADVFIVRKMLAAAGQKVSSTGKADKKFVDAIKAFQKKIGFKYPDGVIDPGGKTFKTLAKRAEKALAADGGAIDVVVVRIDGEELGIPQKDYDVAVALTCKKLGRVVNGMRGHYDIVAENAQFYIDAATGASGFMDALVMWSSSLKANLDPPYFPAQAKAMVSLQRAEKAVASKDVKKAVAAMPTAQADINAFAKQVKVYGDKFCGGAKDMQESLELTRDISFEIATAIGTAYVVSKGRSPAQAKAASGALFAMIKTASTEYGRTLAGYDTKIEKQAMNVLFDGVVAGAKGGLNAKYVDKIGGNLASKVVGKPPFNHIGATALQKATKNFLHSAGKQSVSEVFDIAVKMVTDAGKTTAIKGKKYNWSGEFEKAVTDGMLKVLTAGLFGNLEAANTKLGAILKTRSAAAVKDKMTLKSLGLYKDEWFQKLGQKRQVDLLAGITKSLVTNPAPNVMKDAWGKIAAESKSNDDPKKIATKVADYVWAHKNFQNQIKIKIVEAKKKEKVK